jgi:nucleoside-diphosphate-sugar epimerase
MTTERILVIGACGQIGVELTLALRQLYGNETVLATDIREPHPLLKGNGPYNKLNVLDKQALYNLAREFEPTQIYLLAAMLSATGEQHPERAWELNMGSLINVLDLARDQKISKVFWPSSIAVFGPTSPKKDCPQQTITEPTTVYGISKLAGEHWCNYYFEKFGVDVRSLRYPGLISSSTAPGGGTTDYAVEIFHEAIARDHYSCFLNEHTRLPMLYMPDAIRATLELMNAPKELINVRTSYNLAGLSFTPAELAAAITDHLPAFQINYAPDHRQAIADSWPQSIDDSKAREDWRWKFSYGLGAMVADMFLNIHEQRSSETLQVGWGFPHP